MNMFTHPALDALIRDCILEGWEMATRGQYGAPSKRLVDKRIREFKAKRGIVDRMAS